MGELFPKDAMKVVKAYVETKKRTKGVHILVGAFMEVLFFPAFGVWNPNESKISYYGNGNEVIEVTSYKNAAEYTAAICFDEAALEIQRGKAE